MLDGYFRGSWEEEVEVGAVVVFVLPKLNPPVVVVFVLPKLNPPVVVGVGVFIEEKAVGCVDPAVVVGPLYTEKI